VANANRSDSVQLAARIPKRLHRALRLECAATGVTMQVWVRDALTTHLQRVAARRDTDGPPSKEP
jgi:predicted HicB family RNase H-like nuclease